MMRIQQTGILNLPIGVSNRQTTRSISIVPIQNDRVTFTGHRRSLVEKYGIDPQTIRVEKPDSVEIGDKAVIVENFLKAHEQALKNQALGNESGRYWGYAVQLANGRWGVTGNIEVDYSRDKGMCAERSGLISAWNQALQRMSLPKLLSSPRYLKRQQEGLKIKAFVAASTEMFDPLIGHPCSECQGWMAATNKYFSPDTLIIALRKDSPEKGSGLYLEVKRIRDIMPLIGTQQPSMADIHSIPQLPIDYSPSAQTVLTALSKNYPYPVDFHHLLQTAGQTYVNTPTADLSGKFEAAAVQFEDDTVSSSARYDWTQRWMESPERLAIAKTHQDTLKQGHESGHMVAIAYYGEDKDYPSPETIGLLAQKHRGSKDILIAVIENNRIQVRTFQDYSTVIYQSAMPAQLKKPKPSVEGGV
jgi:hypothetical protein